MSANKVILRACYLILDKPGCFGESIDYQIELISIGHNSLTDKCGWSGNTIYFKNMGIGISNSKLKHSLKEIQICRKSISKEDAERVLEEYNLSHINITIGFVEPS